MHEYGIGLREMDGFWMPGRTLLYLRKIGERYAKQKKARKNAESKTISEKDLFNSDFMRG